MKIGNFTLSSPIVLAPLAGYTDVGFRALCREAGAGLTYTEMISAKGLYYGNDNTKHLLVKSSLETPSAVQIFGSDSDIMAKICEGLDFDIVDINMGCPVPKIVNNHEGSYLMRTPKVAEDIVKKCAKVLHDKGKALTVKCRIGISEGEDVVDFARRMRDSGVDAITVHGRTREQLYMGKANWDKIAEVKRALDIPVIGNGDISSVEDVDRALGYGVDGVMIGRGALGKPQLFATLRGVDMPHTPREYAKRHVEILEKHFDERYIVANMKKHICYYAQGNREHKAIKNAVFASNTIGELYKVIEML